VEELAACLKLTLIWLLHQQPLRRQHLTQSLNMFDSPRVQQRACACVSVCLRVCVCGVFASGTCTLSHAKKSLTAFEILAQI